MEYLRSLNLILKRYLNVAELIRGAMDRFVDDVKSERFPSREFIY